MKKQISVYFDKIINILFNIITLNKWPFKESLTYFLLLLLGIISSLIVRFNCIDLIIDLLPEYINNSISIISILYSL